MMKGAGAVGAWANQKPQQQQQLVQQKMWPGQSQGAKRNNQGGTMQPGQLKQLEGQLSNIAWKVYESILDLNVPSASLQSEWSEVNRVRDRMLAHYGIVPQPAFVAPRGGGGMPAVSGGIPKAGGEVAWKSKLNEFLAKAHKRSMSKGELVFEVVEDQGGYIGTLSSPAGLLSQEYQSEFPATSKKMAEHQVSKVALQAEFPQEFFMLEQQEQGLMSGNPMTGFEEPPTKKRKIGGEVAVAAQDPKSRLMHYAQLLLERPVTKTDVVFEVSQAGPNTGDGFSATVSMPEYDPNSVWQGQLAETRKSAETFAAEVACLQLTPIVAPLEVARKEKKAKLAQEKLAALKARSTAAAAITM